MRYTFWLCVLWVEQVDSWDCKAGKVNASAEENGQGAWGFPLSEACVPRKHTSPMDRVVLEPK